MIPYKFQTNPGFFKQIAEQQAAFAKKMSSWTKFAQKAQKELDQKYRTLIPVINLLSKNGWVITPFFEIDKLFMLRGKSTSYCIQFMTDYYSKDGHKQFFYEFDQLLKDFIDEDFDDGYLDQLQKMRKLVQSDFKNSDVLINTAVSILRLWALFLREIHYVRKTSTTILNTMRMTGVQFLIILVFALC